MTIEGSTMVGRLALAGVAALTVVLPAVQVAGRVSHLHASPNSTTVTNNTGEVAGFLHLQSFTSGATLPSVNAPGCGTPTVFGSGFEYWEITWPSPCVEPGASVSFELGPPGIFPSIIGHYWATSPPVVSAVNNTGLAANDLRIVVQAFAKGATLVQNAPGCQPPGFQYSSADTVHVTWSSACVAPGAKVSIHVGAPGPVTSASFTWSGPGQTPTPTANPTPTPTAPACQDPTPNGGGRLAFSGIGTVNHNVTRRGDVCPGIADVWTFSDVTIPSNDQFLGVKVVQKSGTVSVVVAPPSGAPVTVTPDGEWRVTVIGTGAPYRVTVTGTSSGLASYRIEVCRSLVSPCVFGDEVTAKPGDVDCSGTVDSRDAFLILQYAAGLIATLPCQSVADTHPDGIISPIDSVDAEIVLQFVAGLIPSILVP